MGLEWFLSFLRPGVLVKQTPERANITSADRLSQRDSNDIIHGQGQHIVIRGPCERVGLQHHLTIDTEGRCSFWVRSRTQIMHLATSEKRSLADITPRAPRPSVSLNTGVRAQPGTSDCRLAGRRETGEW
jgi:hypothetical protein